jgi:two-component system, chemotaxis family, response regulator WspF
MRIAILSGAERETEILQRAVALKPEHQLLWSAKTGAEAVACCVRQMPDLVLMDSAVGGKDGVDATRRITVSGQCAILLVTGSGHVDPAWVFEAMGHGALDVVAMPVYSPGADGAAPFLSKLAMISRLIADKNAPQPALQQTLVAIGASAGGPKALATMLRELPRDFPAAIVIIQHVEEQFARGMADLLSQQSALPVAVAREGDSLETGRVLLAGSSDHLTLKTADRLGYTLEPRDYAYRPSIDVFLDSVARLWRGNAVGVLLTGMGRDGAVGLKALRNSGYYTIAQDQLSSAVYGMPKAAATLKAAVDILPMDRIAARLIDVVGDY